MTINELQIQLDLNQDHQVDVLNDFAYKQSKYFLFVDSEDGQCYLFDKNGNQIGISNLEQIEYKAFYNCKSLTSISIPNSVKSIGYSAFSHCTSLTSISIPIFIKSIGNSAFARCTSLTSINIPDSVEDIGSYAFYYCTSLTSISIPDSVKRIRRYAFEDCTSLKEVIFKGKTIDEVKAMDSYPWGIEDESIIKCV